MVVAGRWRLRFTSRFWCLCRRTLPQIRPVSRMEVEWAIWATRVCMWERGDPSGIPMGQVTESSWPSTEFWRHRTRWPGLGSRNSAGLVPFCHFPPLYPYPRSTILHVDTIDSLPTLYLFRISTTAIGVEGFSDVGWRPDGAITWPCKAPARSRRLHFKFNDRGKFSKIIKIVILLPKEAPEFFWGLEARFEVRITTSWGTTPDPDTSSLRLSSSCAFLANFFKNLNWV